MQIKRFLELSRR